jgi:hypothetical protein
MSPVYKVMGQLLKSKISLLFVLVFCLYLVLIFNLSDSPEKHLAKVDFLTIYDRYLLYRLQFGFFLDNLGIPWPVRNTGELIYYIDGYTSWFPYKDIFLYFIIPAFASTYFFYKYFSFLAKNLIKFKDPKFVGFAGSCFLLFSPILIYVFSFGWSVPLYWGLVGLGMVLNYGVRIQFENRGENSLYFLNFFVGAVLAGTLMHFLLLAAVLLFSWIHKKKYFYLLCLMLIANCYYVLPEIFKTFFLSFDYYQGVDPVKDGINRFSSLTFSSKFSLLPDTKDRYYFLNTAGFILITIAGLIGLFFSWWRSKAHNAIQVVLIALGIIFFDSILIDNSLYAALLHLPFFGGMFRDTTKFSVLLLVCISFFCGIFVSKFNYIGRCLVLALLVLHSFYFVRELRRHMEIKGFNLPQSYQQAYLAIEANTKPNERVLLIPVPKWFHRYSWNQGAQVQNLFRGGLKRAAIFEETDPPNTIPPKIWENISLIQTPYTSCQLLKQISYDYGIGAIVLQKDMVAPDKKLINVSEIQDNLERCDLSRIYSSKEIYVYLTNSRPLIEFCKNKEGICNEASLENLLFGAVTKLQIPSDYDQLHLNYRVIDNSFLLISADSPLVGIKMNSEMRKVGYSWTHLKNIGNKGNYFLINTTKLVAVSSYFITIIFFIGLGGYFVVHRIRNLFSS